MGTKEFGEILEKHLRPATQPLGVRFAALGEAPPEKFKALKHQVALCQAVTLSRTLGWTMVLGAEDHGCPIGKVFLGHVAPDKFLEGKTADFYQENLDVCRTMEALIPKRPVGEVHQTWLAPLTRCEFTPDVALAYGNPAQILLLIQAANFDVGTGVKSLSMGRGGCSSWITAVPKSGECTYMVPGPGERVFGGCQDFEMSFAIPVQKFDAIAKGLEYLRKQGAYRYPVPNMMLLAKPAMPAKYYLIDESE